MKQTFGNNLLVTIILVTAFVGWDVQRANNIHLEVKASEPTPTITPTPSPTPFVAPDNPRDYIIYVFGGEDAKKAFLLLQGTGESGSCAENRQLDPKAVNDNRTWGGVGRDVSIFQVNDVYHPVAKLNLEYDWRANIDYAKRMFDHDGGSFGKRWTCGKYYKSLGYEI